MRARIDIRSILVATTVTVALLVAGCNTPHKKDSSKGVWSDPAPQLTFNPPTRFDRAKAVQLPEELGVLASFGDARQKPPGVLYKTTLYVPTSNGLLRVDTTTGRITGTVTARREQWRSASHRPLLANLDGVPTILMPFPVTIPGSGTTPSSSAVEIHRVTAEDGADLLSVEVAIDVNQPAVVAVYGSVMLLNGGLDAYGRGGTAYGIELATGKVLWKKKNFHVVVVEDDLAIGIAQLDDMGFITKTMAVRIADGGEQWSDADTTLNRPTVESAGPGLLLILGTDGGNYLKGYYRLANTRTGIGARQSASTTLSYTCRFDEVSVAVCSGPFLFAMDVNADHAELWRLPDGQTNRVAPTVTAVWHGAVYGQTEAGPLVLDARTGADLEINAGVAPILVNEYVGIAVLRSPGESHIYAVPPVA